jgi:hypothetical protein
MKLFKKLLGGRSDNAPLKHLEEIYTKHLGPISSVLHETENRGNHVDVYCFKPTEKRDWITYLSGGMSRQPQPQGGEFVCVELLLYASHHEACFSEAVRQFCHYPWETGAAFEGWDLLPLGEHARVVLGSDRFGGILVCPSTRRDDQNLATAMRALNPSVSPLNLIPLLADEFEYVNSNGVRKFLDRVSASRHSVVLSHARESVLSDTEDKES